MIDAVDVIVVGAGPGGSEFAYRMACDGYAVLVLERDALDREKPCGGGIQTQEILEFGPLPDEVVERHIEIARIVAPDGGILEVPRYLPACGATVKRSVYDRWLSRRAELAGASYLPHCRVVGADVDARGVTVRAETPRGPLAVRGRLCAVASGGTARELMRSLGLGFFKAGDYAITVQYWIELGRDLVDRRIGDAIELYTGSSVIPRGYAWIFPKRDVVTVGLGCDAALQDEAKVRLRARLDDFLRHHPVASGKLAGGRVVRVDGGPIPFFVVPRLTTHSTLLLGDAGGFGNAIHGGGIYQARKSAVLAAPYARDFLETGSASALEAYAGTARAHFREYEGRWDVKLRPFFWEDDLVNTTVRRAAEGDRPLVRALGVILNSDRSHEAAYRLLEPRMLDLIHDCLRDRTRRYGAPVEAALAGLFRGDGRLDAAVRHVLFADAKRVRASLALMAAEATGGRAEAALPMAVGFELLHTASLIHDDIMDDAQVRRGRPCVHRVFGTGMAITAGDALIFEAYRQVLSLSPSCGPDRLETVLRIFSACAAETCRGQAEDLTFPADGGTIRQYLRMVRRKTGSMIEAPLESGAVLGGADPVVQRRFRGFGRTLGIAFQIVDDAIDYLGSEEKARKTLGNDLRRRSGSAMLIVCRARCTPSGRDALDRAIARFAASGDLGQLAPVLEAFRRHDAIAFTQRLCARYAARARRLISGIGVEPARSDLEAVARMVGYWGLLDARLPEEEDASHPSLGGLRPRPAAATASGPSETWPRPGSAPDGPS